MNELAVTNGPDVRGQVVSVRGSQAHIALPLASPECPEHARATVGKFMGIQAGTRTLVGVITDVRLQAATQSDDARSIAEVDLIGEIRECANNVPSFRRGVTSYPAIGDRAGLVSSDILRLVFDVSASSSVEVGQLQQDPSLRAFINTEDMLCKHFAVLGTTGVGKSSAVALLLRQTLATRNDLRVLLLDAHNEYGRCFGDKAQVLNPRNLKLPFWLFNFEEIIDILFGGRPALEEEIDLLSEAIPLAKATYAQGGPSERTLIKKTGEHGGIRYTADIPVPYRISDLLSILDLRMGKLENRSSRMVYHRLIARIEGVSNDPRYTFMFEHANVGGDTMADVLSSLFRLPTNGVPMTIMQLAGFPSEVVDAIVSVLSRMAFDLGLWSEGNDPLLIVCEEAHRYMAADRNVGFGPTRRALSRIAKEGRKYGVFLGLVTQRPAELDPTILSQCSTLFAMRMTNDRDQSLLRSAIADSAAHMLSFLPSLGTGEAFAFGEGVALPTRLQFSELPPEFVPKNESADSEDRDADRQSLSAIIDRWRGISARNKKAADDQRLPGHPVPREESLLRKVAVEERPLSANLLSRARTL